ncbi:MAG: hypothetical protein CM15mP59_5440 [Flavobacteriaceae bacterium]|nr:MAG: hypothetical protein CM15mP59_5440 [Flavobacteriaceae bacterium]
MKTKFIKQLTLALMLVFQFSHCTGPPLQVL